MSSLLDTVTETYIRRRSKSTAAHIATATLRASLLSTAPESYAKACTALAEAPALDFGALRPETLIVTGSLDAVSPPAVCEGYVSAMAGRAGLKVLEDVGHWSVFEDLEGVAGAVGGFLGI